MQREAAVWDSQKCSGKAGLRRYVDFAMDFEYFFARLRSEKEFIKPAIQ